MPDNYDRADKVVKMMMEASVNFGINVASPDWIEIPT
jgi:hypothetical protein